jgi:hypothetical protein
MGNGKKMWLRLRKPGEVSCMDMLKLPCPCTLEPSFSAQLVAWVISQQDMRAGEWFVVDDRTLNEYETDAALARSKFGAMTIS